jgi:hypothetical protein
MRFTAGIIVTIIGGGLLALFIWLAGAQLGHGIVIAWIAAWPVLLPILLAVLFLLLAAGLQSGGPVVGTVVFGLLAIVAGIFLPYAAAHKYAVDVHETTQAAPDYQQRYPYMPATQSSQRNLQDITGDAQTTKSLPGESQYGTWNTPVVRRGVGVGYEAVQTMNTPLYGEILSKDVSICKFEKDNALRLGGALPNNNLSRAINWATPANVSFDDADAYSYCDGETPLVVVPLKQLSGFFGATWTAYGDAVYNGKTGALSILTNSADIAKLKGSVYPLTLAADTRNAYQASGDIWAFWQGRSGYGTSSSDADDPNLGNDAEFNLRELDNARTDFVTPLLPRGSSKNVVALGVVDARKVVSGQRNPLVIHRYAAKAIRQSTSTVENSIKADYSLDGAWSSGLTIFEVVPEANGNWVASIGKTQTVAYRAYIKADGTVTLYNASGEKIQQIDDSSDSGQTTDTGTTTVLPSTDSDLSKLTPKQLQNLGEAILKELASRSTSGSTATPTPSPTATK